MNIQENNSPFFIFLFWSFLWIYPLGLVKQNRQKRKCRKRAWQNLKRAFLHNKWFKSDIYIFLKLNGSLILVYYTPSWIYTGIWSISKERYTIRGLRTEPGKILSIWPFENSTTLAFWYISKVQNLTRQKRSI